MTVHGIPELNLSSSTKTPNASELEEFFGSLPDLIRGRGANGIVSYSSLENAQTAIRDWCAFSFSNFHLAVQDNLRIGKSIEISHIVKALIT